MTTPTWRWLAFIGVYSLAVIGVTGVFLLAQEPSADTVTEPTETADTPETLSPTSSDPRIGRRVTLGENTTYDIGGSIEFPNTETLLVHDFSLDATGSVVELQLRDATDRVLAVLRSFEGRRIVEEDLVIALPADVVIDDVAAFVVVNPTFDLVLSRAEW